MLAYEDRVAGYVKRTGGRVLYRATPVFEGDDLVARGVLLEALSAGDGGTGLRFCAWCYNIEPGIEIDYANGESRLASASSADEAAAAAGAGEATGASAGAAAEAPAGALATGQADVRTYILNTNTHKFHYPDCPSVGDMAEHNKWVFEGTREQAIEDGYNPCGRCNP